jgi:isopropylmalate/homocitrate/citramalate synthase
MAKLPAKPIKPSGIRLKLNQEDLKLVTQRIIELEIKKKTVTKEDLPYIISDVLHSQIFEKNSSRILYFISCQGNAAFNYTIFKNRRQLN